MMSKLYLQKPVIDCIKSFYEDFVNPEEYSLETLSEITRDFPDVVFEEYIPSSGVTSPAAIKYTGPRWAIGLLAEALTSLDHTIVGFDHEIYKMDAHSKCVIEVTAA